MTRMYSICTVQKRHNYANQVLSSRPAYVANHFPYMLLASNPTPRTVQSVASAKKKNSTDKAAEAHKRYHIFYETENQLETHQTTVVASSD